MRFQLHLEYKTHTRNKNNNTHRAQDAHKKKTPKQKKKKTSVKGFQQEKKKKNSFGGMRHQFAVVAVLSALLGVVFESQKNQQSEWRVDFKERLYNPKVQVVEGELRPGVTMRGIFAREKIKKGEYVLSFGGYIGKTNVNYSNLCQVLMYSLYVFYNGEAYLTSGKFYSDDRTHTIPENQAMFLNEASPNLRARFDSGNITLINSTGNKANLCMRNYAFNSLASFLVATTDIDAGEELTWYYGPQYFRYPITEYDGEFKIGEQYSVATETEGECITPFLYMKNLPEISTDDPNLFLHENLTNSEIEANEAAKQTLMDAKTQLSIFSFLSSQNFSQERLVRIFKYLTQNASQHSFNLTLSD